MIYLVQPSLAVTSWRTLWPGEELRRRGYDVQIDTMDSGYSPAEPPEGATVVLHVTPSLSARREWMAKVDRVIERAGRLIVQFDDDWTLLPEVQTGTWD